MSKKDYFTHKKALSGNTRSHALNHSRRKWNLNLQSVKVVLPNGQIKKVKVSTKTLKTLNKKKVFGAKKAIFFTKKSLNKDEKKVVLQDTSKNSQHKPNQNTKETTKKDK